MARDHVPCSREECNEPAAWILWSLGTRPTLLCNRETFAALGRLVSSGHPALAIPLIYSLS